MNSYDILDALGCVDDVYIARAREIKSRKGIRNAFISAAACFLILIFIPIAVNFFTSEEKHSSPHPPNKNETSGGASNNQDNLGNYASKPDIIYNLGSAVTTERGTIKLTEHDAAKKTVSFVFDKKNYMAFGFNFIGYNSENKIYYNVITESESFKPYPENAVVYNDKLIYTVNGKITNELPQEPGIYEITVDYSRMYEFCNDVSSDFLVVGFGMFTFDTKK